MTPDTYTIYEGKAASIFERLYAPVAEYNAVFSKIEYCKRHNAKVPDELAEMLEALEKEIRFIINS